MFSQICWKSSFGRSFLHRLSPAILCCFEVKLLKIFFFLICIFCGWVLYFLNIFILIFDAVNNILIIVWFFVIYFCYCPCFIVSCSSWFTLIAKLWACGSSKFKTSLVVSCLRKLFFLLLVLVYFSIYI